MAEALHLELAPPPGVHSTAHASVSINSLGPLDNIQVAATGLERGADCRLVLAAAAQPQDLAVFKAGMGGTAIPQSFGPLKNATVTSSQSAVAIKLEIRSGLGGVGEFVLRQLDAQQEKPEFPASKR